LHSTDPGQVSPGIGAPVAAKSDDFGFEFSTHWFHSLLFRVLQLNNVVSHHKGHEEHKDFHSIKSFVYFVVFVV
jgi:hypothetical protein